MRIRSKPAVAGLALVLASAIPGRAAVLHVPADYTTVQAAVDAAASGDEIQIAAGVYTNQVVITNKNLALSGSPGAVMRATPSMHSTLAPYTGGVEGAALLAVFESDVLVSGLTFEGERLAEGLLESHAAIFDGIWFFAANGRVENCRFMGFRGATLAETSGGGDGVHVVNPHYGYGVVNVDVSGCTFADNMVSINLIGDGGPGFNPNELRTTFSVDDNTIIGNGPDTNGVQYGIRILHGSSGEVKRNAITDHAYMGTTFPVPFSFGIVAEDVYDFSQGKPLAALQPVRFEGNVFRDNQIDLLLVRGDGSTIVNNSFEGTAPGYRPRGLAFSGENVLVGTNRFSDMDTGIVLFGDDPDFGTYLGIASNAVLTANSFCNVTNKYDFESLTSYDLQSTMECQPPALVVTKSVLLSWPYHIQGYSVQTAPTPSGPWTNSDATVFLQDGQNSAAIPMDGDQGYVRLVKP